MANESDDKKNSAPAELYYPPNHLAKAIGIGGGPSLREMEEAAGLRLSASRGEYKEVLQKTLARMKEVLASEREAVEQQREVFADAHDIKGQAPMLGYPLVGEIAVCTCSAIKDMPEKLNEHPDLLQLHVNAMRWAFLNEHDEGKKAEKSVLVQSLQDALARV